MIRNTNKMYRYVLGIDPSGAFYEGKGTTGWCILDSYTNKVLKTGTINAKKFNSANEYWEAHTNLLKTMLKKYGFKLAVSIEDYILYKNHAMAQVNSKLETVQLIGILKQHCYTFVMPYFLRPAVAVKIRWSDDNLVYECIIIKVGNHYIVESDPTHVLCDHERDAIRHAVHFSVFENAAKE